MGRLVVVISLWVVREWYFFVALQAIRRALVESSVARYRCQWCYYRVSDRISSVELI